VSVAAQIAERPKEQQRKAVDRVLRLNQRAPSVVREMNRQDRFGELIAAGTPSTRGVRRAAVILADPPWRYDANSTSPAYAVKNHYPTMAIEEICALPLRDLTLTDCVLFLWAPSCMLRKAMTVIEVWGFAYQTCAVWDKQLSGPLQRESLAPRKETVLVEYSRHSGHYIGLKKRCAPLAKPSDLPQITREEIR
jgi:hypothetical protein